MKWNTSWMRLRIGFAGLLLSIGYALYEPGPSKIAKLVIFGFAALMMDGIITMDYAED